MSEIDFEFATRDDCLQKMVPSDLRVIIRERDQLREEKSDLLSALENLVGVMDGAEGTQPNAMGIARAALAKAKGEQG